MRRGPYAAGGAYAARRLAPGQQLTAAMTLTPEQSRALVDAIATAPSLDALADLRRVATREQRLDARGSFLELLIEIREEKLAREGSARRVNA